MSAQKRFRVVWQTKGRDPVTEDLDDVGLEAVRQQVLAREARAVPSSEPAVAFPVERDSPYGRTLQALQTSVGEEYQMLWGEGDPDGSMVVYVRKPMQEARA